MSLQPASVKLNFLDIGTYMFYGDTIQDTRHMFFNSWENYQNKKPLSPLEHQVLEVILAHPEYHKLLDNKNKYLEQTHFPELGDHNPFLHMGLHLAIREQIATDRPSGMNTIFKNLVAKYQDSLEVEHLIMEQLAEHLWHSHHDELPPDENDYLNTLTEL